MPDKHDDWLNGVSEFLKENWFEILVGSVAVSVVLVRLLERIRTVNEIHDVLGIDGEDSPEKHANRIYEKVTTDLNRLVGLESVKRQIERFVHYLIVSKMRERSNLKNGDISLHMIFYGAPGTGKTTVARILGKIYKDLGFLSSGHVVEVDKGGLEGMYVGHTAAKTRRAIERAMGGVLFVDEAYALYDPDNRGYGHEAIATLLKEMEDKRGKFVVIMAGYEDEMTYLINSNPGLRSRLQRYIRFPNYSNEELFMIFKLFSSENNYVIEDRSEELIKATLFRFFEHKKAKDGKSFGNARTVRNLFEKIKEIQAERVVKRGGKIDVITLGDVEIAVMEEMGYKVSSYLQDEGDLQLEELEPAL